MRIYYFFILFITTVLAKPFTYKELKKVNDKMFTYHVLFDSYNRTIAERSVNKIFAFLDPVKFYFFESDLRDVSSKYDVMVDEYNQNKFYTYQRIQETFIKSIKKNRRVRSQARLDIINDKVDVFAVVPRRKRGLPLTDKDQKNSIINYMSSHIQQYSRRNPSVVIDRNMKIKILDYHEKKMLSHEEVYMSKEKYPLIIGKAIASSLDAHSMVYGEQEISGFNASLKNQFEGIGIYVSDGIDGPEISGCIKGGPAERNGAISKGSRIRYINGVNTQGLPFNRIMEMLSIRSGEKVFLDIETSSGERAKVKLVGEKISMKKEKIAIKTEAFLDGQIVQLKINSFYDDFQGSSMSEDLRKVIAQLKKEKPIYGLIIDMRHNLGGFFKEAVKGIALFSESETIVIAKFKNNQTRFSREYNPHVSYMGPVIILTSKYSASAAEILAQSLQDVGAAIIAGDESTYGKGSIQFQTITDPNSDLRYKVTVGKYYTISGISTQMKGVKADIVVPSEFCKNNIGEKFLAYALPAGDMQTAQGLSTELKQVFDHYHSRNPTVYEVMKPQLKNNSTKRIKDNKSYQAFIQSLEVKNNLKNNFKSEQKRLNYGKSDLPMQEAVYIIKDMHLLLKTY